MDGKALVLTENKFKTIADRSKQTHLTHVFNLISIDGLILEFGVFQGNTINHIATLTKDIIHGFDSFEGLPEPWVQSPHKTEDRFNRDGIPPEVADNVQLHTGWFDTSISKWKEQYKDQIKFLHIDSDLYSSCKTILTELNKQIVPGTIIVFDELFGYANWREGEHKALLEWLDEYDREVLPLNKLNRRVFISASVEVIK